MNKRKNGQKFELNKNNLIIIGMGVVLLAVTGILPFIIELVVGLTVGVIGLVVGLVGGLIGLIVGLTVGLIGLIVGLAPIAIPIAIIVYLVRNNSGEEKPKNDFV